MAFIKQRRLWLGYKLSTVQSSTRYQITNRLFFTCQNCIVEIQIDIIVPIPTSENTRYCVTIIDRLTRWPEAFPVTNIRAESVADVFFRKLSQLIGFKWIQTTAYSPKSNGMLECWHRTLKAAIMCSQKKQCTRELPIILLGLRSTLPDLITITRKRHYLLGTQFFVFRGKMFTVLKTSLKMLKLLYISEFQNDNFLEMRIMSRITTLLLAH